MPELPEVETTRRGIEPHLTGQIIIAAIVRQSRLRYPISNEILQLHNQSVLRVERRAKYLLLVLPTGWITIHLGMSGSIRILPAAATPQKHDHIDLLLSNGKILRYNDPRRFGSWLWCDDLSTHPHLVNLGVEPLDELFSDDYLFNCSRRAKTAVKPWLMSNKIVVGVGNIYASESLFLAGIKPTRPANSLTQSESEKLVAAIKTVLSHAIAQGGTTLRDFLDSDGKPGYFAQALQVYGRSEEICYRCGGEIISVKMAQRNTFYCSTCQY